MSTRSGKKTSGAGSLATERFWSRWFQFGSATFIAVLFPALYYVGGTENGNQVASSYLTAMAVVLAMYLMVCAADLHGALKTVRWSAVPLTVLLVGTPVLGTNIGFHETSEAAEWAVGILALGGLIAYIVLAGAMPVGFLLDKINARFHRVFYAPIVMAVGFACTIAFSLSYEASGDPAKPYGSFDRPELSDGVPTALAQIVVTLFLALVVSGTYQSKSKGSIWNQPGPSLLAGGTVLTFFGTIAALAATDNTVGFLATTFSVGCALTLILLAFASAFPEWIKSALPPVPKKKKKKKGKTKVTQDASAPNATESRKPPASPGRETPPPDQAEAL